MIVPGFSACARARGTGRCPAAIRGGPADEGREAKRTFAVLDHAAARRRGGTVTVVGRKFTTYRLMAERVADVVCAQLGVDRPCTTASYVLPDARDARDRAEAPLAGAPSEDVGDAPNARLADMRVRAGHPLGLRAGSPPAPDIGAPWVLDDLRRDLRLGMGPCQGGFCGYRGREASCTSRDQDSAPQVTAATADFAQRRWKGQHPLLWGQSLRQALLDEQIYRGNLWGWIGWSSKSWKKLLSSAQDRPGCWPLWVASQRGAKVRVLASGIGTTHVSPGWIRILSESPGVSLEKWITMHPEHPYTLAGVDALAGGPAALREVCGRSGFMDAGQIDANFRLPTALGAVIEAAVVPESFAAGDLRQPGAMLIAGPDGWRDFYPKLCADNLARRGCAARQASFDLPELHTSRFDATPVGLARLFDRADVRERVAAELKPKLDGATRVGFPVVLGLECNADAVGET